MKLKNDSHNETQPNRQSDPITSKTIPAVFWPDVQDPAVKIIPAKNKNIPINNKNIAMNPKTPALAIFANVDDISKLGIKISASNIFSNFTLFNQDLVLT